MNETDVVEKTLIYEKDILQHILESGQLFDSTKLMQEYQDYIDNFGTCLRLWRKYKKKEIIEFP